MQEFESWRVKDLEARNKREKARSGKGCHLNQTNMRFILCGLLRNSHPWPMAVIDLVRPEVSRKSPFEALDEDNLTDSVHRQVDCGLKEMR